MTDQILHLHSRLRSCLQTILDLEPELVNMKITKPLLVEFQTLRDIYHRVDSIAVKEDDVLRIERATEIFLNELRGSMQCAPPRFDIRGFLQ